MREFLGETMQLYLPSRRDLTAKFCRKVLAGDKELLHKTSVLFLEDIPQDSELKTTILYDKVKVDKDINLYLPDYPPKKIPNRVYLCNVINTLHPGVFNKLVKKLKSQKKKEREKKMKKYVKVRKKFSLALKLFVSKRKEDPEKIGRFIGLMQEDRKKNLEKRKSYSKVKFDFELEKVVKKVKP